MTLAPADRRLLYGVLAPPEDYRLDEAIGTTYTLDLLALLRVPLSATTLAWENTDGGPVMNPFALLAALRENAHRISLYCHAGMTKVPDGQLALLTFLEDCVHPVSPPHEDGVFHPKIWLLRYCHAFDDQAAVRYRLIVLSRNLTFDRSWDIAATFDGVLTDRKRAFPENAPLSEFIASLPGMARRARTHLPDEVVARAELLADEVRTVRWDPPEGVERVTFHPIGHDGEPRWPVTGFHRLLVLSPFVSEGAVGRLRSEATQGMSLISRFESLASLNPELIAGLSNVDIFDDVSAAIDGDGETEGSDAAAAGANLAQLTGLHAKVFAGKRGRRSVIFVGSANATQAAFERNVEFVVELEGPERELGIDRIYTPLVDAGLLRPFCPGESPIVEDPELSASVRLMERVAHALSAGGLCANAREAEPGNWTVSLQVLDAIEAHGLSVYARPIYQSDVHLVDLGASPAAEFRPVPLDRVTAFFVLEIHHHDRRVEPLMITARLPFENAPSGRGEAVTASLLGDPDLLMRFILALLSVGSDADRVLGALEDASRNRGHGVAGSGLRTGASLPVLEPMLRALHHDPERLDEVERLLADLKSAASASGTELPSSLSSLWEVVDAMRVLK
jgi:hypothetical protein